MDYGFNIGEDMIFLTKQEKAKIYVELYINNYNLGDYLKAIKDQGLESDEAELIWESIDHYEDTRPEEV